MHSLEYVDCRFGVLNKKINDENHLLSKQKDFDNITINLLNFFEGKINQQQKSSLYIFSTCMR